MVKEKILDFDICSEKKEEIIKNIFEDYKKHRQIFIANINPEIVISNYKNEKFREKLNEQKYQIPDGSGIVWASKKNNGNIKERITGIDLMLEICNISQKHSSKIFLYGAKQETVEKAKKELQIKYPKINIIGISSGYSNEGDVIKQIEKSNADIVFVGLGSPKQENFIINHKNELKNVKIFMPVGGSFDVVSKEKKRAPNWMIKLNLEWFYRLIQEPKRIFRQAKLIKFIFLVLSKRKDNTRK